MFTDIKTIFVFIVALRIQDYFEDCRVWLMLSRAILFRFLYCESLPFLSVCLFYVIFLIGTLFLLYFSLFGSVTEISSFFSLILCVMKALSLFAYLLQEMVGKYKANFYMLQGLTLESRKR